MPQLNLSDEMLDTLTLAVGLATVYVEMDYKDADDAERARIMAQCDEFTTAALMLDDFKEAAKQPENETGDGGQDEAEADAAAAYYD